MMKSEFIDLSKLAQKRTRETAMLVLQLLENDDERVAMMIFLALDLINGATEFFADDKNVSQEEAFAHVFDLLVHSIGVDKVMKAVTSIRSKEGHR